MIRFEFSPRQLAWSLLIVTGVMILGHCVGLFFHYGLGHPTVYQLVPMFNLTEEKNAPTYFSALLLLLAAALLLSIGVAKRRERQPFAYHWIFLAAVFVFLSCDEIMILHERLIQPMQKRFRAVGFAYFAWVIPYGVAVLVLGAAYLRFLWSLPQRHRHLILAAAMLFLGGAIGLESLSASVYYASRSTDAPMFVFWSSLEEVCEMLGVIVFIYALSRYMADEMQGFRLTIGDPAASSAAENGSTLSSRE